MERKLILFEEMGVKSVPDFGYSGRCYKMLLASIKLRVTRVKKKKQTPKRLLLFHAGHVLVVCRIVFSLSKNTYTCIFVFLLTFFDLHTCTDRDTYMYGQFFHLCALFFRLWTAHFQVIIPHSSDTQPHQFSTPPQRYTSFSIILRNSFRCICILCTGHTQKWAV